MNSNSSTRDSTISNRADTIFGHETVSAHVFESMETRIDTSAKATALENHHR